MAIDVDVSQLHRFSLDEYHRLVESGGMDEDARVELIDGLLVAMSPKTREHENAVAYLAEWLMDAVDRDAYQVRVASALTLTLSGSEPEPDLIVIPRGAPRPYHPGTAALVIEVAVSSLRRDLGRKVELYARAGVAEYWVADLEHGRLVVHRDVDPARSEYRERIDVGEDGTVTASALPLPELGVASLLAAAES